MKAPPAIQYVPLRNRTLPLVVEPITVPTSAPGQVFRPHRHDFQELLWLESGTGVHSIDGRMIEFRPPSVSVITRGQVHAFQQTQDLQGFVVSFTEELFAAPGEHAPHQLVFNYAPGDQAFTLGEDLHGQGVTLLRLMLAEYGRAEVTGDLSLLRPLLEALLALVGRAAREASRVGPAQEWRDLPRFLALLERDFVRQQGVEHYAQAMNVSARHLSRLTHATLGKNAKQVIQDRRILEARRLLSFTDMSVKEVAVRLGFADPFHFSRAFKAASGVSPQTFRARREPV
ncbi:helix-turn-helix transcriptional regulator [Deinococcus hopiensis]|uniref:helix-turn-helix transcriptional regulator n=1 Tax=Deinococcus hopiensis TaxID=309885 RepID=UPI0014827323|nr:AraC family transcriptional regulator [Deinococcus hopiensis]